MHPGAVIIDRPYDSLEEWLEGDAWTVARGDMLLLGVSGVELGGAVEFSIVLSTGEAVVSGEGRVVEYLLPNDEFEGGTRVKFRKLDADSKAVLRRALELQRRRAAEAAAQAEAEAQAEAAARPSDAAAPETLPSSVVHELPSSAVANEPPSSAMANEPPPKPAAPPPAEAGGTHEPAPAPASGAPRTLAPLAPMTLDPFPVAAEAAPVNAVAPAAVAPVADAPVTAVVPAPAAVAPADARAAVGSFTAAGALRSLKNGRPREVPPPPNRDELLARLRARRSTAA